MRSYSQWICASDEATSNRALEVEVVVAVLAVVGGELATRRQLQGDQPLVSRGWLRILIKAEEGWPGDHTSMTSKCILN